MFDFIESIERQPGSLDRFLRIFGDVRAGEGGRVLLMFLNIFVLLVAYYILKTVREPLILVGGGAELKAYASAAQALSLIFYVPLYGWVASRLPRQRLVVTVVLFFVACIQLFFLAGQARLPNLGFVFFVWVGIFNLTMIAQFWSFANDIYSKPEGDRLFPLVAIGSTAGAPIGALVAERLFGRGLSPYLLMEIAAGLLLLHLALYRVVGRLSAPSAGAPARATLEPGGGFSLVLRNRYLLLIAGLLVLLNVVNTTGEYILGRRVLATANTQMAADTVFNREAYIGHFYGEYLLGVSILTILIQAFLVSRIVMYLGMGGALFALPLVACGVYGLVALGVGLGTLRWAKTAENSTDYSVMNTAKQMLWLPTTLEEKYKAKQATDTFFVRAGDLLAAGVVFAGTRWLGLDATGFAGVNLAVVVLWALLGLFLLREYRRLAAAASP